jgi:hypothetical protein
LKYKYRGPTPKNSWRSIFLQNKKKWRGTIFEGRMGMIIYQLSWIGLIYVISSDLYKAIRWLKVGSSFICKYRYSVHVYRQHDTFVHCNICKQKYIPVYCKCITCNERSFVNHLSLESLAIVGIVAELLSPVWEYDVTSCFKLLTRPMM